jgi:tryptophan synthase alpha subunit
MPDRLSPSLRHFLTAAPPGNQVIAYLTLGDPSERFVELADELLAAGALTLELGFPHAQPLEGKTLLASHRRALAAGVDTDHALALLAEVAARHSETPLVAVVQWQAIEEASAAERFLDALAAAGAAAFLPVGIPMWQCPVLAAKAAERGLQTVLACPSDASRKLRDLALRYCTGCLYVPRARMTGTAPVSTNTAEFCRAVAVETDLPMIVGVGVNSTADVSEICASPAKAAAVGSALVDHVVHGGAAGGFIRQLLGR